MHLHVNTSFMFMEVFVYETSYGKFGQILYYILLKSIPCWPPYTYNSVHWFYLLLLIVSCMVGWRKKARAGCLVAFRHWKIISSSFCEELIVSRKARAIWERNKKYKAKPTLPWIFLLVLNQFPSFSIFNLQNSSICHVVFFLIPYPVKI